MYDLARTKFGKKGTCELCGHFEDHLERHHISYKPEITRKICHHCHFTAHFYPDRLPKTSQILLLNKIMTLKEAFSFAAVHGKDRVKLAKAFAPSRRSAIREAQKLGKPKSFETKDINSIKTGNRSNRHS